MKLTVPNLTKLGLWEPGSNAKQYCDQIDNEMPGSNAKHYCDQINNEILIFNCIVPCKVQSNQFLFNTELAFFSLATEIQNIQLAEGDVCRGLPIPIHMIFPRLFTCPTLATNNFKVGKYTGLTW